MPKTKTLLQAAADAETEEKRKGRIGKALGYLATVLGVAAEKPAAGKMRKVTETHKHVKLEEEEGGSTSGEEEEEEEEESLSGTDDTENSESGTDSEEEEEEEEESEEEDAPPAKAKRAKAEEEEEEDSKALARATRKAYAAADVAFLAAVPEKFRASAALRAPSRLAREAKKATGAHSIGGAMTALSRVRGKAAKHDGAAIQATAKLAARVAKVEKTTLATKVDALVSEAKTAGKASTKELRAELRTYGNDHGTRKLKALIASLPVVAPSRAKIPRDEETGGAPSADQQRAQMRAAATQGLSKEDAAFVLAEMDRKEKESLNGAARGTEA